MRNKYADSFSLFSILRGVFNDIDPTTTIVAVLANLGKAVVFVQQTIISQKSQSFYS